MLHPVHEHTCENAAVLELLATRPILEVANPEPEILLAVLINIGPKSTSLTVDEFTLVLIAIRVVDVTDAMCDSVSPFALVLAAVRPALLAAAVLDLETVDKLQLSSVDDLVSKVLIDAIDNLGIINRLHVQRIGKLNLGSML